jgi:hypothetical protein
MIRINKDNLLKHLVLLFIITNIIDGITAYFILPAETNPIYLLTGSWFAMFSFKMIIVTLIALIVWRKVYPGHINYYFIIHIILLMTFLFGFAAYGNIVYGMLDPQNVEYAKTLSDGDKHIHYFVGIAMPYYILMGLSLLSFTVYHYTKHTVIMSKAESTFKEFVRWLFRRNKKDEYNI